MKAWSAALSGELAGWPQVNTKSFFGFTALYRRDQVFGFLPRSKSFMAKNAVFFNLENASAKTLAALEQDSRIGYSLMRKKRWLTFEIAADADLHAALDWFGAAYDAAGKPVSKPGPARGARQKASRKRR